MRGQLTLETAIIFPIVLIVIMTLISMLLMIHDQGVLQGAVHEVVNKGYDHVPITVYLIAEPETQRIVVEERSRFGSPIYRVEGQVTIQVLGIHRQLTYTCHTAAATGVDQIRLIEALDDMTQDVKALGHLKTEIGGILDVLRQLLE